MTRMNTEGMDNFLRMAQLQTIIDVIELLTYLRGEVSNCHYQRIDEMLQRLATMSKSL